MTDDAPRDRDGQSRGVPFDHAAAIRRARDAVASMQDEYLEWVRQDLARLEGLVETVRVAGGQGEALAEMYRIGHDMCGQGGTFGFPLVSRVAVSLCRLLRLGQNGSAGEDFVRLVARHVAAARAIIERNLRETGDTAIRAEVAELERAVGERRI